MPDAKQVDIEQILRDIGEKFSSGNDIPVMRASLTADEWKQVDAALRRAIEALKLGLPFLKVNRTTDWKAFANAMEWHNQYVRKMLRSLGVED